MLVLLGVVATLLPGPTSATTPAAPATSADEVTAAVLSEGLMARSPSIASEGTDAYVTFTEAGPGVRVVTIRDEGARPQAPVTLTVPHPAGSVVDEPAVAAAGDRAFVAWDQQPNDGSDGEVYIGVSPDRGATWKSVAIGAPTTRSAYAVKVAASESLVAVTYMENGSGQVLAVTSTDGGATWQRQTVGRIGIGHDLDVAGDRVHVAYADPTHLVVHTFTPGTPGRHVQVAPTPRGVHLAPDLEAMGDRVHVGYSRLERKPDSFDPLPTTHHIASSADRGQTWSSSPVSDESNSCPLSGACHPIDIDASSTRVHGTFFGQDRQVHEVFSVDQAFGTFATVVHASDPNGGGPTVTASDSGAVVTWANFSSPLVVDDDGNRTYDVFESVRPAAQRTPESMSWSSDAFHSYGAVTAATGSTYGMAWVRHVASESGVRSEIAFRPGSIGTPDLELLDVRAVQASVAAERLASGKETVLRARLRNGVSRPSTFTIRWTYDAVTAGGPKRRVEDQRITLAPGVRNVVFHPTKNLFVQEGEMTVHAQLDWTNEVQESDETNNEDSRTHEVVGVKGLTVLYVPLDVAGEDDVDCLNSVRLAAGRTSEYFEAAMPIDELNTYHQSHCANSLHVPFPTGKAYSGMLFSFLGVQKQLIWNDIDFVVAVAPDGFFKRRTFDLAGAVGAAVFDGDWGVAVVEERAVGGWSIAHEISHDRGWVTPEVSKGEPHHLADELAPGYHIDQRRQIDLMDFMAPKADADATKITRWISPRSWDYLLDSFRRDTVPATAGVASQGETVVLAGALLPDGTVVATPPQTTDTAPTDSAPTATAEGDVTVRFLDDAGAELGRGGLAVDEIAGLESEDHDHTDHAEGAEVGGTFRGTVPVPSGTATLVMDHGGQERFRAERSDHTPTVEITSSTDALTLDVGDDVPLTFTSDDADGDAVDTHVEHSIDGGATWMPSADDLVVAREQMGHDVRYRVVATDGWHRTVADGPTVTVHRPLTDGDLAQVEGPGMPQLLTSDADGSGVMPLVTDPVAGATWPEWRPDGERIAFEAQGEIVTTAADGTDRRAVGIKQHFTDRGWTVANGSCPSWSPDGQRLAVWVSGHPPAGSDDPNTGIWVVDPSGGEDPRLAYAHPVPGDCALDWSADDRIWFVDGDDLERTEVFSMRPDGSEVERRIANPSPGNVAIWSLEVDPSAELVLTGERDRRDLGGHMPLYVTKVDGSGRRPLTDLENLDGDALEQPSWAPTGAHVWAMHSDGAWNQERDEETYGLVRIDPFSGGRDYIGRRKATHPAQRPVLADRTPEVPSLRAAVAAPITVPEGGSIEFDAADSRAEAGISSIGWDTDGDQTEDATGTMVTVDAVDDGTVTASAVVTDSAGQEGVAVASPSVTNVAPVVTSAAATTDGLTVTELRLTATDAGELDELVADIMVGGTPFGERRLIEVDGVHRLDATLPPASGPISVTIRDDDGGSVETAVDPDYVENEATAQAKAASGSTSAGDPLVLDDVVTPVEGRSASVEVLTPPADGTVEVLPGAGLFDGPALRFTPPADAEPGEVTFEIGALGHAGYPEGDPATVTVQVTSSPDGPDEEEPTPTVDAGPDIATDEGAPAALVGTVADLGEAELRWVAPIGCMVADASSASTTVACADQVVGVVGLEARVGDQVVARDDAALAVGNVAPSVVIQQPAAGAVTAVGQEVTIVASAADVPADPVTVTIDTGDGSPATRGTSRVHKWSRSGTYTVTVVATDDDGGRSTATTRVVVEDPVVVGGARTWGAALFGNGGLGLWARGTSTPNGSAVGIVGGKSFQAKVTGLAVAGTTATAQARGRWGTLADVGVEITVEDGGTRLLSDKVRVVVRDARGKVVADSGRQTAIGAFTVRTR